MARGSAVGAVADKGPCDVERTERETSALAERTVPRHERSPKQPKSFFLKHAELSCVDQVAAVRGPTTGYSSGNKLLWRRISF
jgi:hypothetical protein